METNDIVLEGPMPPFKDEREKARMVTWFKDLAGTFGCEKATVVFADGKVKETASFVDAGNAGRFAGELRNQGFAIPVIRRKSPVH